MRDSNEHLFAKARWLVVEPIGGGCERGSVCVSRTGSQAVEHDHAWLPIQPCHTSHKGVEPMDTEGFRQFLQERELAADEIDEAIALVERFEEFLDASGQPEPTAAATTAFSVRLIEQGLNTMANFYALARYGRFLQNDAVYVAVLDLLDGAEAMEGLYDKAGQVLGEEVRDELFQGIDLPPLGTPNAQKVRITQAVMPRLVQMVDDETCHQILGDSLRYLEDKWFFDQRQTYLECESLDEFLARNEHDFLAMLEQLKDEGTLFFTQEITDDVLDYVRSHPEIERGVREGKILYEVKIPHMTKEYLAETDEQMKRYYYCHCPWVKEALRAGDAGIPPIFCDCSAGFHKKRWEVILDQPLQAEIVESVLQGDLWCKIAIHLPEGV
jgi:hypothetical protein